MNKLQSLKAELDEVNGEIEELKFERNRLEDKIEQLRQGERFESVVLSVLNENYNHWCSLDFLFQNIHWQKTDFSRDEWEVENVIAACESLVEKGIIQSKETGSYDDELDPICDYRITDTETPYFWEMNRKWEFLPGIRNVGDGYFEVTK